MQKSKAKLKVKNENDVKFSKLPRSIQKSDNILGNTCEFQIHILLMFHCRLRKLRGVNFQTENRDFTGTRKFRIF